MLMLRLHVEQRREEFSAGGSQGVFGVRLFRGSVVAPTAGARGQLQRAVQKVLHGHGGCFRMGVVRTQALRVQRILPGAVEVLPEPLGRETLPGPLLHRILQVVHVAAPSVLCPVVHSFTRIDFCELLFPAPCRRRAGPDVKALAPVQRGVLLGRSRLLLFSCSQLRQGILLHVVFRGEIVPRGRHLLPRVPILDQEQRIQRGIHGVSRLSGAARAGAGAEERRVSLFDAPFLCSYGGPIRSCGVGISPVWLQGVR
mmetsp:Transcript_11919/g.28876  ORF Transcript_11919/g.28876 Transcript_11919/m.28876 type:complete len:256 (-) Transcript_11919:184-951(-)